MVQKIKKSGRIDVRTLTTLSRASLGESVQSSLSSWPLAAQKQIPLMVDAIVKRITQAVEKRQVVRFKRLGSLVPSFKPERAGARNIKSGDSAVVSARWVVTFKRSANRECSDVFSWSDMLQYLVDEFGGSEQYEFDIQAAREIYAEFTRHIGNITNGTTRIELRGLGSFHPSLIKGQIRRNPKTGESVSTEDRITVRFRLSKTLAEKING